MSSVVISTSAALGRPFLFDADVDPEVGSGSNTLPLPNAPAEARLARIQSMLKHPQSKVVPASVTPASQLAIRPAPEMASSGISELDALAGGLPRGCLTEICGPASSGRTSVLLAALAAATRRGEYCAVIDAYDSLDPQSVAAAGVDLDRLLWVRCGDEGAKPRSNRQSRNESFAGRAGNSSHTSFQFEGRHAGSPESEHCLEQVLRATDLLLESGGFGLIILELGDVPAQAARRIPLTTWFRFRRTVEHKPTILLAIEQQPIAGSCSSLLLKLGVLSTQYSVLSRNPISTLHMQPTHAELLSGLEMNIELVRSRLERKPARPIRFESKAAWTG